VPGEDAFWLAEIAYQLAVMNERNASGDQQAVDAMLKKVGLGSTVPPDSESALRGDNLWHALSWALIQIRNHNSSARYVTDDAALHEAEALLNRTADERTTPPNPQTSSIQTQEK
jgi:hypothetical protein